MDLAAMVDYVVVSLGGRVVLGASGRSLPF